MDNNNNKSNNTGSTNNNKSLLIAGIVIIVVIALAIIIPHIKKSSVDVGGESTVPGAAVQTPATSKPSVSSAGGSAGDQAWQATLGQYKGRSIVFGTDCTALPNDQVQPVGTKILLVNNGDVQHTISVGNESSITIGAKHYKTATIGAGVSIISCDSVQKAATVTVK